MRVMALIVASCVAAWLATESKTYQLRFAAHASSPDLDGLALATVRVPEGGAKEPECAGIVFEQPGPRAGLRSSRVISQ